MPPEIPESRLFDAAVEAVIRYGYTGATTKRIAELADVGEMTLFRRFGTKDDLIKEALQDAANSFVEVGIKWTGNVREDLIRTVEAYAAAIESRGRIAIPLLAELQRLPELRDICDGPIKVLEGIARLISRYQERGSIKECDPMHASLALIAPILLRSGVSTLLPTPPPPFQAGDYVERFLAGWSAGPSRS